VHQITQQQEQRTQWLVILTTSICIVIILRILCFTLYSHCHKLQCYSLSNTSNPEPSPQTPLDTTMMKAVGYYSTVVITIVGSGGIRIKTTGIINLNRRHMN